MLLLAAMPQTAPSLETVTSLKGSGTRQNPLAGQPQQAEPIECTG
jgi:hypothetical protein